MMFSNPEHLTQIGCHINTTVFLDTSVFGQGVLVLPLRKGVYRIVHGHNVAYVPYDLQRCNIYF